MRSTQRLARRSPRTPAENLEQRHDRPRSSSWDLGPGARPGPAPAEPGTGSPCRRGDYSYGRNDASSGDAAWIEDQLGGLAQVVVLCTGDASFAFSDVMPPRTEVYGGAGRAYPPDDTWVADLDRSPLRFVWPSSDPARLLPGWWTTPNEWHRSACERGPNRAPVACRGWSSQSERSTLWSGWTMVVRAG